MTTSKGGRPKKQIDYETVKKLASIMCTQEEIANHLELNVRTLQRDEEFSRIYKTAQETGKMSLRRAQFESAIKNRSVTMQIWLGKQYLGQRENPETDKEIEELNNNIIKISELLNNPKEERKEEDYNE